MGIIYYSVSGENDEESLNVTLRQLQDVHKAEIKIRQNSSQKMYALYVFDGNKSVSVKSGSSSLLWKLCFAFSFKI